MFPFSLRESSVTHFHVDDKINSEFLGFYQYFSLAVSDRVVFDNFPDKAKQLVHFLVETKCLTCHPSRRKTLDFFYLLETVVVIQSESQRQSHIFVSVYIAYRTKDKVEKPRHNILLTPNFRYSLTYLTYQVVLECIRGKSHLNL